MAALQVDEDRQIPTTRERLDTIVSHDGSTEFTGQPTERLEIDDTLPTSDLVYPTGAKVWLALIAIYTAFFLNGLDLTIVAVAIPRLTDYFKTVEDIGWYSAAYGLMASAFIPFFGKACTVFSPKSILLVGLAIFTTGSVICTFSYTSKTFIIGRAVAGLGISGLGSGGFTLITHMFPLHKRSIWLTMAGTSSSVGLCTAPIIGGLLIDKFGWRACFGINIPLCPVVIAFTSYFLTDPMRNPGFELPFRAKLKKIDLLGTLLVVPAIACLLLGLQWGGMKYGWGDSRIIVLFVVFAALFVGFGYFQYRLGEKATVPFRILKKRNILAAMWFAACCNGILAITEAYISIYWQGIRGETPTASGLLGLSMIVGLLVGGLVAGFGTTVVGYFTPFMVATSIMAPVASGLLTTINLDENKASVVALLGFLGFAVGIGLNGPVQAVSATLASHEVSLGVSLTGFGGGMGSALFISAAATLFQGRLTDELSQAAPGTNVTSISHAGLSDIRGMIGPDRLEKVLSGYNRATVETLYMPLVLALLTLIGSAAMEWISVKKKQN